MRSFVTRGAVVLLVALGALSAWQSRRLAAQRQAGLPEAYVGVSVETPPGIHFLMVGLTGFRGIVAEILWFRAHRLQEEGRHVELVQLADWIARLNPRAAEAWVYKAWNLAYNISVMMIRPEDRLRWVNNGISLLRDQALRINPRDARLHRELAWIYQNKIGDSLDDAHLFYKFDLAETMAPLLDAEGALRDTPDTRARLADLRLDADAMLALETRFGPLDWRLAESHALYWAIRGFPYARGAERLLTRRGIYQPLVLSVFRGRFVGNLEQRSWATAPNQALALPTADFLLETLAEHPTRTMALVAMRFLAMAAQNLDKAGQHDQARALFDRLLKILPPNISPSSYEDFLTKWDPDDHA